MLTFPRGNTLALASRLLHCCKGTEPAGGKGGRMEVCATLLNFRQEIRDLRKKAIMHMYFLCFNLCQPFQV